MRGGMIIIFFMTTNVKYLQSLSLSSSIRIYNLPMKNSASRENCDGGELGESRLRTQGKNEQAMIAIVNKKLYNVFNKYLYSKLGRIVWPNKHLQAFPISNL